MFNPSFIVLFLKPLIFLQPATTFSNVIFAASEHPYSCSVWAHQSDYLIEKWVLPLLYETLKESSSFFFFVWARRLSLRMHRSLRLIVLLKGSLVTLSSIIYNPYGSHVPFLQICVVLTKQYRTRRNVFDIYVPYHHAIISRERSVLYITRLATNGIFSLSNKIIVLVLSYIQHYHLTTF
jgi:hypothetical protein